MRVENEGGHEGARGQGKRGSWEAYRDVLRLGRKTRLPESRHLVLWSIFKCVRYCMRSRGRSHTLRINYRTSHQIRLQADKLLGSELSDVDGNTEERGETISVFNEPKPTINIFDSQEEEMEAVSHQWLSDRRSEGMERTKWVSSCGQQLRFQEHDRRPRLLGFPIRRLTRVCKRPVEMFHSAPCTLPKAWSFGQLS